MTQDEKDILLKDLCARVPYGVKYMRYSWDYDADQELPVIETLECVDKNGYINHTRVYTVEDIKPYLFPLSSMTEEQKKDLNNLIEETAFQIIHSEDGNPQPQMAMDWYNKNHFDVYGLIPMGLGIDATNKNIY